MDSLIGTIIFLLPGLLLYFWVQYFGINPVVKHSPAEFTAITVLLWFPVSASAIYALNWLVRINSRHPFSKIVTSNFTEIWTLTNLKNASDNISYLIAFIIASTIISFIIGLVWSKWIHYHIFIWMVNRIRISRDLAPLSKNTSVWDEIFLNNNVQVVEVGRIDKKDGLPIYGCIKNTSRPFEPERHLYIEELRDFDKDFIEKNDIEVEGHLYDIKSGSYVKIFNYEMTIKALNKHWGIEEVLSPRVKKKKKS
ncbi:hypothetical protein Back11_60900 [Paenibacillus baekrokdamisoli]|uniref:Uncharacterized protein n=1 Tax=Paenibacillus baekrokdamisoli TaxID=1712516 RepID=A0A3G9J8R7_9BACL|nr:DUF6338 family protein [Paenibacillus baekrokdamisoli]MBB3072161.1 hypothetical protein [Paenibacillus baekrokdamisoli]BBH24745.1 hypothetical protein Back11_60900 [Paenibacillus baekrokdamisoli]